MCRKVRLRMDDQCHAQWGISTTLRFTERPALLFDNHESHINIESIYYFAKATKFICWQCHPIALLECSRRTEVFMVRWKRTRINLRTFMRSNIGKFQHIKYLLDCTACILQSHDHQEYCVRIQVYKNISIQQYYPSGMWVSERPLLEQSTTTSNIPCEPSISGFVSPRDILALLTFLRKPTKDVRKGNRP